jgi:hypothetical protein
VLRQRAFADAEAHDPISYLPPRRAQKVAGHKV